MSLDLQNPDDIWRIEPLSDYKAPPTPTQETLRKKFALMFNRVRAIKSDAVKKIDQLQTPPAALLDRVMPPPPLDPFFAALDTVVDDWLDHGEPKNGALVLVLPPCDKLDLMRSWAGTRRAEIAPEPSSESVFAGDLSRLPSFEGDQLLIIPKLELWFRRHHAGLVLVRDLIARLSSTKRRCVVGVNSWAWAYLARATDAGLELRRALSLTPFDDRALCVWLSDLAKSAQSDRVLFRRDDTGEIVFDPPENCSTSSKRSQNGRDDFLKALAATSRGSPWLAWHIFRHRMRVERKNAGSDAVPDSAPQIVWIDPTADVALPEMPNEVRASALLLLHALLIHDELSLPDLDAVLPSIRTSHILHKLAAEKLLLERTGKWRVAPIGYPAVRDALAHDGFPLDNL